MILTVNQIRVRWGALLEPILSTQECEQKYKSLSHLQPKQSAALVDEYLNLSLAYCKGISSHLDDDWFCQSFTHGVPPEVIYTTYLIHWTTAQALMEQDQNRKFEVPDTDKEFYFYMFESFLRELSELDATKS